MSLAMAEPKQTDASNITIYPIVVDLQKQEVYSALKELLQLPICFVGHDLKSQQFCLWTLDLGDILDLYDTYVAEKSLCLGKNHWRYKSKSSQSEVEQIRVKNEIKALEEFNLSLTATCQRYGVHSYSFPVPENIQSSITNQSNGKSLTKQQIKHIAEKSVVVARLYPLQSQEVTLRGALNHLITIEMPWVRTNARIEWNGIKMDRRRTESIHTTVSSLIKQVQPLLDAEQVPNVNSSVQLENYFNKKGLLQHFRKNKDVIYSFDHDHLKKNTDTDLVVDLIVNQRKLLAIQSNPILSKNIISKDGRVHPQHH